MPLAILLLAVGTLFMALGAEAAVRGTGRFAMATGIPAFVLGALVFGIDLEGMAGSLVAAGRGQTALAAGDAYGTVLFLFGAGFGVALLVSRRAVPSPTPLMVIAPALTLVGSAVVLDDRVVSRLEGAFLILLYVGYVAIVIADRTSIRAGSGSVPEREGGGATVGAARAAVMAVLGLGALFLGAWMLVAGGIRVLSRTGLEAGFVGAAIVAALASLDEVLLEVLPIRRGHPELATGNLFGTLAAFTSVVPGIAALIRPLQVDGAGAVAFIASAAVYAFVAVAFLLRGRVWRVVGLVVLLAYAAWLVYAASL